MKNLLLMWKIWKTAREHINKYMSNSTCSLKKDWTDQLRWPNIPNSWCLFISSGFSTSFFSTLYTRPQCSAFSIWPALKTAASFGDNVSM